MSAYVVGLIFLAGFIGFAFGLIVASWLVAGSLADDFAEERQRHERRVHDRRHMRAVK